MSKSAWIDKDSSLDIDKITKYGLDTVYIDPRAANADIIIHALLSHGITPGAYFSHSWGITPEWVSTELNNRLPKGNAAVAHPAMLDLEGISKSDAATFIASYRKYQPHRPTAYTNAPFQGGLVPVEALKTYNMPFYVQLYYGGMQPADAAQAILEAARDYDSHQVFPFYGGNHLPTDWKEGCVFTLELLP